jgi:hypothetical protein
VTNYGALSILQLPRKAGPGEAAELRLLIALETIHANGTGDRQASLGLVARLAGLPYITARRATDRLIAAGTIDHKRGERGRGGTWRFLVPLDYEPALSQGERGLTEPALSQGERGSAESGTRAHPGRARLNDEPVITTPRTGAHPDRAHALSTTALSGSVGAEADRAGARDDDAQPDWRRGPGTRPLSGRVWPPGTAPGRKRGTGPDDRPVGERASDRPPNVDDLCPRGCGTAHEPGLCPLDEQAPRAHPRGPATWGTPRAYPAPSVARDGAELARKLMADRPGAAGAPPPRPRTEDDYRAAALRQVARSRAERDPPKEDDLEQPPF